MLDHYIQKAIVYKLAFSSGLRFSELKPDELDNKLFNYHLKLVILAGLAKKGADGLYSLTPKGRRVGIGVTDKQYLALERAHSVVFLIIQRKDKAWLFFKRQTHPLFGGVGLMHVNPVLNKNVVNIAQDELRETTGLTASFSYAGNGYFKVFKGNELESFIHFTLLASKNASGKLKPNSPKGEYFWVNNLDTIKKYLLPTAKELLKQYQTGKPFFIDKTFRL